MTPAHLPRLARLAMAAVYLGAGASKLARTRDQLVAAGQGWAGDVPAPAVRAIGAAEVLAALALTLPEPLRQVRPAATGLTALQIGAISVHLRRGEFATLPLNATLLSLSVALTLHKEQEQP